MKSKKTQFLATLVWRVASRLTLSSVFLTSSVIGAGAFAASEQPELREIGISNSSNHSELIAQAAADGTILSYRTSGYSVRVFLQNGRTVMNVYDQVEDLLRLNAQPAEFTVQGGQGAYVSTGDYSGRQARYSSFVTPDGTARLLIQDGSDVVIVNQPSTSVSVFAVPENTLQRVRQDTILSFNTASYAVRVFERDGFKFMNVYNKFTAESEVNGKPASLVPAVTPYENTVSYVASGTRNGQSVEYISRIDGTGGTTLEIFNINGQRLFEEPGIGEVVINIPSSDLPEGVGEIGRVDDAFVAAVFGDENTLAQVQQLYPEAFLEDARQGRFINAGAFQNQNSAEVRVLELRSRGFDARLVFRDVRYR
ncbi:hypothetical protein PN498_19585 [Oscillatoria sp. CS-180]|uniref:hypothetical protein n=1 Tax=Oscillatoria sp. CS-180 TaxID=3021720 RepID=UPI00232E9477|nr:hypothetical protein [Oscillatoria sp. CS-180]MDB9528204.1 hypothetical protein [Oscillatoria sp. CS-180]